MIKPNSLVECIDDANFPLVVYEMGCKTPDSNTLYVVRSIDQFGGVLLEEVRNQPIPLKNGSFEPSFHQSRFVVVQDPVEVGSLIEDIEYEMVENE